MFQWAYGARYSIALKKTHIMATKPNELAPADAEPLAWTWRPRGVTTPTAADKPLAFEIELRIKYLGFISYRRWFRSSCASTTQ